MAPVASVTTCSANHAPLCEWPGEETFLECVDPADEEEDKLLAEYQQITQPSRNPNSQIRFAPATTQTVRSEPGISWAELGGAGLVLGAGLWLGGPLGLAAGALFLSGCYGVDGVGGPNEENKQSDDKNGNVEINIEITEPTDIVQNLINHPSHSLVWSGSEFGISWVDRGGDDVDHTSFAKLDGEGRLIGTVQQIAPSIISSLLVWNESRGEYALAWERSGDIFFTRLNNNGNKMGEDVLIVPGASASDPVLAWNHSDGEYGIIYGVTDGDQRRTAFTRINDKGDRMSSETIIDPFYRVFPDLIWNGNEYGLGWTERSDSHNEIKFARINAEGNRLGKNETVSSVETSASSTLFNGSLIWTGSEYGIAWFYGGEGVHLTRIAGEGRVMDPILIEDSGYMGLHCSLPNIPPLWISGIPSLVWNENGYAVTWADGTTRQTIKFTLLDTEGKKMGNIEDIIINDENPGHTDPLSYDPFLVWTGQAYGLLWLDHLRDDDCRSSYGLRFAHLSAQVIAN